MKPVQASFATTDLDFPAGTVAAAYLATLTETTSGAVVSASIPYATAPDASGNRAISFADVPPGVYVAAVAVVDAANAPLASPVSAADHVTIAADVPTTVSIAVPSSLDVTQPIAVPTSVAVAP